MGQTTIGNKNFVNGNIYLVYTVAALSGLVAMLGGCASGAAQQDRMMRVQDRLARSSARPNNIGDNGNTFTLGQSGIRVRGDGRNVGGVGVEGIDRGAGWDNDRRNLQGRINDSTRDLRRGYTVDRDGVRQNGRGGSGGRSRDDR